MNKKQEVLLWLAGLLLSWWIHLCLAQYTEANRLELVDTGVLQKEGIEGFVRMFQKEISGDIVYMTAYTFQYAIPFLIFTGLLFISLRSRKSR